MIMKKPTTILRTLIFVLAMLFNFATYAQNTIAFNSGFNKNLNENLFLKANNQIENQFSLNANDDKGADKLAAPMVNPARKYAQAPYLGTVSICPNDGKELPKLFLCGSNETRKIETGLVNPQLIVWEKFTAGGACLNVSNTNCANETSAASCWTSVGTGVDYVVSTAGQFRVRIIDNAGTPYTFYFNAYQNTLDPGAIAKNDIIKYGTSCVINGKITVNGFGSGYEYGLTTTSSPPSSWQPSNVFNVTAAGNYNVFIRLSGVAGSCDFKVPNIVIKETTFAVTTQINSGKCSSELGSIRVVATDVNLQYVFKLTGPSSITPQPVITVPATGNPVYTFTGLTAGTYTVETSIVRESSFVGTNCMVDTKINQTIDASPVVLKNTSTLTTALSACSPGEITGSATGGKTPYRYSISIDGGAFTAVANVDNKVLVAKAGNYIIRLEDGNGCTADQAITVGTVDKPIYNLSKVDGNCTGAAGSITVNVTTANGFTDIRYSKDNGTSFGTSNSFTGLAPGIYYVVVQYRKTGVTGNSGAYCQDPPIMINVGAATPLSASGGIAALSGCGIAPNDTDGIARIVNPQGGVPFPGAFPYKYSFDDGVNWQDSNEAYIKPNATYIFKIKDAVGCIFAMPGIKLDAKPAAPTIKVLDPVFNCDGSATTTVQVNGGVPDTKYSYKYYMDGFLNNNTPSNIFLNVGEGKHKVTVEYTVLAVSTYSNLLNENFGSGGTTTTPGIAGTYCFNDQRVNPPYTCSLNGTPTRSVEDNQYSVANDFWRSDDYDSRGRWVGDGAWYHFKDHTTTGADAQGRFLLINIGKAAGDYGVLYSKDIVDVIPNQPVLIDLYVANLLKLGKDGAAPILIFELVDQAGNVVATDKTGKIADLKNDPDRNKWVNKSLSLNPGNNTKLTFKIRSGSTEYGGNDLVMDDIWVRQIPRACGTVEDFDINIDPAKAFSADITGVKDVLCFGDKNGELTITARNFDPNKGFQYSMDDGLNWSTYVPVPKASTGSVTIKNLGSKNYLIKVRYEDIATSCTLPFSQDIKQPAVLDVKAAIVLAATCTEGATIRASATGGTPAYEFELRDATGVNIIKPRQPVSDPVAMTSDFVNIPKGTYVIRGYDTNACFDNINTTIEVKEPDPIEAVLANSSNLCYTATNKATITVTVNGGTAPYTYSLNGAAAQDESTFKNLGPGSYIITVTDSNNCTDDSPSIVINDELIVTSSVTQTLKCAIAPATSSAVITGEIEGGKAAYTVVRLTGPGTGIIAYPTADTFTFTGTVPGLYTFEITDATGCKTQTSATIQSLTNPTVTAAPENPKCFGAATGSVVLSGSGGSGSGYEYNFNGGGFKSDATYSGLRANIQYTYQVKDGNGCLSAIRNFTLTQPAELKGDIKATVIGCNASGTKPAIVTVTGSGGTGPDYLYRFNNETTFTDANTFSTSTAGEVSAYIQDSNGCIIGPLKITIEAVDRISDITITDSGYDCSTTPPGGHVNIAAVKVDISAPIRFQIVSGPAGYNAAQNSDGEFKSLAPGLYMFRALDTKTGCYFDEPYTVNGAPDIVAGGSVSTAIKCFGGTGKIQFTVNGVKDRGYDYVITNAAGTIIQQGNNVPETTTTIAVASALPVGVYTIKATDNKTKCDASYSVTLGQPTAAVAVTATASKINCKNGKSDITVTVLGGTPNYSYAVAKSTVPTGPKPTTFGTDAVLTVDTNSGADLKWIVYVKDANGCEGQFTVDIEKEDMPTVTAVLENQCTATGTGNIFTIKVTGSSGLAPLKYSIDGTNFQSGQTFNVTDGTYTVTVQDKYGCTATASAAIVVDKKLTAGASVTKGLDCSTTPNAVITVNINGGKAPYKYTVQKGTGTPGTQITATTLPILFPVTAAQADKYTFAIVDANSCTIAVDATVLTISNPAVAVKSFVHPSCDGGANGSITLEATGGSGGGYQYSMDGGPFTTDTYYPNLAAGLHNYSITDGNGCPATGSFTLAAPSKLVVVVVEQKFTCNTTNGKVAGTVTLNASGGTGPGTYQYSFNGGGAGSNVLTLNDNGADQSYTYTVTDGNGCPVSGSGTLFRLDPPKIFEIKASPILCLPAASQTSTVTVTTTNGVGTLSYEILSGPVVNTTGATTGEFTGLTPGFYNIKVTDGNGCFDTETVEVKNKSQIAVIATKANDVDCNSNANGAIKYEVSGFTTTYSYTVNGVTTGTAQNATSFTLSNLSGTTTYNVVFTDDFTKCTVSTSITITRPAILTLGLVSNVNANCGKATSTVKVIAGGGTGTYQYAILDKDVATTGTPIYGPSASFNINSNAGADPDWVIFVKDASGCVTQLPVTIATDPSPTVNASVSNQCTASGTNFKIVATGLGGVAPYTYTIDSGVVPSPADTFTVGAGTYIITVRDANNCPATVSVTVNSPLTAGATKPKDITCATPAQAEIEVTVLGGKAPYSYRVKIGAGSYSGTPIPFPIAGNKLTYNPTSLTGTTYEFEISDSNGTIACTTLTNIITTTTPATVTASATKFDPTCNGFDDGSVEIKGTAGVSPFTYALVPLGIRAIGLDIADSYFVNINQFGTLKAGTYEYQVKDAKGCISAVQSITLDDPDKIEADVIPHAIECNGNKPGYIDVTITKGGVGPFTYTIYNNAFTQILPSVTTTATSVTFGRDGISPTLLTYGDYYVTIVDANGCEFKSLKTRILTPPNISATGVASSGTCVGGAKATINVLTAVYPVTYSIFGQTPTPTNSYGPTTDTSHEFTGLDHGTTYQFQVIDAGGCFTIVEVTTPNAPSAIALDAIVKRNVKCFNDSTGEIDFTVRNFGAGVDVIDYEVRDELTNLSIGISGSFTGLIAAGNTFASTTITGLKAGNYTLYVKEKDGTECNVSQKFQILQPIQGLTSSVFSNKNANCNGPAQVTLRTTGGTAQYKYAYTLAPALPTALTPTQTSNVLKLDPGVAGTDLVWNVLVTDANGCSVSFPVTIAVDKSPVITAQVVDKCVAQDAYVIKVDGTLGTGVHTISVDNKTSFVTMPSLPFNVTGLHSGDHTIYVQDVNGCIDEQKVTIDPPLGLTPVGTTLPTCADNDGVVTVTPIGGSGTFTYSIAPSPASVSISGNVISGLPAGSYTVTITDSNTLCTEDAQVSLLAPTQVTFDADPIAASCFGARDGSITVNLLPANNNPVYTYTISPIPAGMVQVDNVFSKLPAGTYDITVRSGRSCSLTLPFTVTEPKELFASAAVSDYNCDAPVNGKKSVVVTVTPDITTGTAPYRYKFGTATVYDNVNTLTVYNDGVATQTIAYSVIDANNCTFNGTETVDPYEYLSALKIVSATPITCDDLFSTVTIEAEGGYPFASPAAAYTYEIVAPVSETGNITGQASGIFTGLKSGLTYIFKATDSHGCSIENTHKVEPVVKITSSGANVNNVGCKTTPAGSDGTVAFTIANFTGAYTYTLSTALGTVTKTSFTGYDVITVEDLPVGTYQIDIEDSVTGCPTSATAAVTEPTDPLSIAIVSNKNANCDFGAKVVVQAAGGTLDYKYAFAANGAAPDYTANPTKNSATLDPTKTWIAWVQDKNNCEAQIPIPIATDPNPTIASVSTVCFKDGEGPVTITLNGVVAPGTGAPKYNIGNGWTYDNTFELYAPGPYVFSIMDGNGCKATTPFDYTLNPELLLTADKKSDITCKAGAAGEAVIDLLATQGSLVYNTFEVSTDGITFLTASNPFRTTSPGTYTFRVTDAAGCQAVSKPVIVTDKTTPDFTYVKKDITCFSANNGSFKITPIDGLAPYKYSIDGGVTYPKTGTDNEFIGLTPQTYHVYVMDAKECVTTHDITIDEPGQLAVDPVVTPFGCSPTNAPLDAVVTLNATFGTTPYSYSFDNGATFSDLVNTLSVQTAQTIKYVVVDKNGCRVSGDAIVNVYSAPHDMVLEATPIYCSNVAGTATVTVTSVAGPPVGTAYTYEITSPIASAVSNNNGIFAGLLPNTYTIKVTDDASHCYTVSSIEVKKAAEISVEKQSYSDVQCNGTTTGSVTFTVSNYITAGAYTYNLTNNTLGIVPVQVGDAITYSGLGTGTYTFNVSDNVSGCTDSVINFLIDQPAKPLDFATVATDINCINKNAIITVTVDPTTGTGPSYQYAVLETGSTATPVYGNSNKLEVNTNNGTKISWDVYVKDANNCSLTKVQTIATAALPAGISIAPYSQCPDPLTKKYTFTVNVTSGVAPFKYSINGVDFQTDNTFIVDNAGTYNVTVKDSNDCPALATVPVVIAPKLTIAHIIEVLPSCDERDGRITVSATGGSSSANYVYNLDDNGFPQAVPTYTYTNISSGAHFIEVLDTATGCKDRVDFTIKAATPVVGLTVKGTAVTCFGSTNGTITASITTGTANDNPLYRYELFGTSKGSPTQDVNIPLQTSGSFTNLKPGDYTVRVVSGRGCRDTKFFRVLEPAIISLAPPVVSQYGCLTDNKTNYATVTIDKTTITGGSGNYTRFQFVKTSNANEIVYEGTSNVYTESDFLGGKYIVNVFDDKGCMATSTEVEIFPFTSMEKIDVVIKPITCATNEDITVTVKDFNDATFTIPLEYKLDGVNGTVFTETNTVGLFTNLPIGHYLITVRNPATGCIIKKDHFVNDPNTFTLSAENVTNIKCYGAADGSVDLVLVDNVPSPINKAGVFTYNIFDGLGNLVTNGTSDAAGKATISGLLAGTYNVKGKLSNTPFCDIETTFSIQQPIAELKIFEVHAPISCTPGNDGKITISADGGWPGAYQYELVGVSTGYSSQFEFSDLTAGTYTLNVKDTGGCIATTTVILNNPTPIVATAAVTANVLGCFGDKSGVITVSAPTGGQGSNYAYILNMLSVTPVVSTVSQDSPVFTGLGAGKYSVTIVDQLNCSGTTAEVTIDEPIEVVPTLQLQTGITCKTDATLTLSAVGGTGPYQYSADKNFTTVLGTLPATFSVGLGDHQYFVRDSKGCVSSISNNVKIDPLTPLTLKLDLSNALVYCKGSSTAAIDAEAVGGLTNYVYTLFDGNGVLVRPAQQSGYFDLLPKGVYVVRVDSGDCQYNSASITIDEPAQALSVVPTVTDATCFGANDGKISIAATGGTGIIKYAISPNLGMFDDIFVFDRLAPGWYKILVQDENSCFQLLDLEVKEPTVLGAKVVGPIIQEICAGDKDGAFTVEISGGRPPYSISLDNENGTYIPVVGTQHSFANLIGGTHNVFIKDASCVISVEVAMDKPVILDPTVEISYDCVNNTQANMVTVTVDESNTDLTEIDYALDGTGTYQPNNIFTNLAPGNHYVTARHTNGCEVPTASFEIKAYTPLGIKLSDGQPEMNVISVTGTGGAPAYEYSFNGEPFTSSNTYKIYKSGDYVVVVRDQNGCTATITVPMVYIDVCLDNYFTPNGDGVYDTWGPGCTNIYNNLEFSIFDRYGRVIAKYHYGQKWDGRYDGAELPSGDYWYVLKLNDEKDAREFVGHFTLYR